MYTDVKDTFPKVPVSKTTGHTTSTFQNCILKNKLLQELGEKMGVMTLNTVQSKVSPFVKFTTIILKSTIVFKQYFDDGLASFKERDNNFF